MPRTILPYRLSASAAMGLVACIALVAACSDRETPTDVSAPVAGTPRVTTPSLAAGSKPGAPSGYEVKTFGFDVVTGNTGVVEVLCSPGKRVLGGGFHISGGVPIDGPDVYVYESSPRVTSGTEGWRLEAMNRTGGTRRFDVYVICAAI